VGLARRLFAGREGAAVIAVYHHRRRRRYHRHTPLTKKTPQLLWAIGLYTANFMKDLLLLPRPRFLNDRVVSLERVVDRMAAYLRRATGLGYSHNGSNGYNGHGSGTGSKYASSSSPGSHGSAYGQVEGLGLSGGSGSASRDTIFGLPCTRSFSATLLPIYLLLLMSQSQHLLAIATSGQGGYDQERGINMASSISFMLLWLFLVSFSRMYLGVQSPTDVMAGALVGGLFLAIGYVLGGAFDAALTLPYSMMPFFQPLVWWLLLLAYPSPIAPSRNFTETAAVAGCAAGWALGGASCFACLVHPVQPCLTPDCFWLVVLRSVLGLSTMIATQVCHGRLVGAKKQLDEM